MNLSDHQLKLIKTISLFSALSIVVAVIVLLGIRIKQKETLILGKDETIANLERTISNYKTDMDVLESSKQEAAVAPIETVSVPEPAAVTPAKAPTTTKKKTVSSPAPAPTQSPEPVTAPAPQPAEPSPPADTGEDVILPPPPPS